MRRPPRIWALAALLLCLPMLGLADDDDDDNGKQEIAGLNFQIDLTKDAIALHRARPGSSKGAGQNLQDRLADLEAKLRKLTGEPEPQPKSTPAPMPSPKPTTPPAAPATKPTTAPAAPSGGGEAAEALAEAAAARGGGWGYVDPYINNALQNNPNSASANTAAAQSALAKGDFAGARNLASNALKSDPGHSQALGVRASANNALGERAAALKDAKSVLKLSPEDKTAKSLVSMLEPKEFPKDAGRLQDANFGQAGDPGALGGAGAARSSGGGWSPARGAAAPAGQGTAGRLKAAALTQKAAAKLALGDPAGAVQAASGAIARGASGSGPHVLRGQALDAMGRHEEAVRDETAALEKEMDSALAALMERAWAQARRGSLPEARADARAAETLAPEGSPVLELARGIEARPEAAGAPGGPAAPALPVVPDLYAGILPQSMDAARQARERLAVGDTREALRLAARAVALDRGNHLAFIVSAAAHRLQGRFDAAVQDATEALRLQPRAADALLARSLAYLHLKDWVAAEADASAAVALDPGRIEAYRQRLLARRMLGDAAGSGADERQIAVLEEVGRPVGGPSRAHPLAVALALGGVLAGLAAWRLKHFRRPHDPPTFPAA